MKMKTKTKKCGVFAALAAALFITAALVTTCVDPVIPGSLPVPKAKQLSDFVPPEGKGYVMLNFAEGGLGRTIRPNTAAYADLEDDFTYFDVHFLAITEPNDINDPSPGHSQDLNGIDYETLTGIITLDEDTYTVSVWAYDIAVPGPVVHQPTKAVAYGTAPSILTITSAGGTSGTITLKEVDTGPGTGTFKLGLTAAATTPATGATLTILTYPDGDPTDVSAEPINVGTQLNGTSAFSATLPSGYYTVALTLTRASCKTITIPEVLHIFQGMTSTYERTLPNLNPNVYTITYTLGFTSTWTPDTGASFTHGSLITKPSNPTRPNHDFDGWFTTATGTTAFDFTQYYITDKEAFAQWTELQGTLTIVPGVTGANLPALVITNGGTPVTDGDSVSRATPPTLTFTANATGTVTGDWTWHVTTLTTQPTETSNVLNLDFSQIDLQLLGEHEISAKAVINGVEQSTYVTIKVTATP